MANENRAKRALPPRVALLLTVLLWGCSFVATKAALREISPISLVFLRFALGTALLLGVVLFRKEPLIPPRDSWPALALMGFVGVFVHHLLQGYGLQFATAVHSGWLIGLIPIWSALLYAVFMKERFSSMKVAGFIGGFAGALLVISQGHLGPGLLQLPSTRGDFLMLISTLNWAVYTILGHATIKRLGATRATAGAMLFGWLMVAPVYIAQAGWREIHHLSLSSWGAILFLGLGSSGLGYLVWYSALARLDVSRVASFLYLQPLVTLAAAALLLHEQVTVLTMAGGCLVLASVYGIQRAPGNR
jgi:drug/metabolite transporter (DMT)-like permease